jgi:hypothetical protein
MPQPILSSSGCATRTRVDPNNCSIADGAPERIE